MAAAGGQGGTALRADPDRSPAVFRVEGDAPVVQRATRPSAAARGRAAPARPGRHAVFLDQFPGIPTALVLRPGSFSGRAHPRLDPAGFSTKGGPSLLADHPAER